jgi:hypothetical protein
MLNIVKRLCASIYDERRIVLEKWSSGHDVEVVIRHNSGGPLPLRRTMFLSFQSDVLRGTRLAVVWAHLLWN